MFPTAHPPRADEDVAEQSQVVESAPGEVSLDAVIRAQSSSPQIAERMIELENCVWSLAGILLLLPKEARDRIGANNAIEKAKSLLLKGMALDHLLELDE